MTARASQYIQTLAQCGSVTRAADQLFITPSALSKYIATLEKEAGTPLFSRVGKHFVLTYAGERYLDWCLRMDALRTQMDSEMIDLSQQKKGHIRIGAQAGVTDFLVERVMPEFIAAYPDIRVGLSEDTSYPILQQMRRFQLDAAISTHPPGAQAFHQESLLIMDNVLIVPREHPLAARAIHRPDYPYPWVNLEWCRGERFVMMHPGQSPREMTEETLRPIWNDIRIVMEVRSMRTMIEAVHQRIGIVQSSAGMERIYSNRWDDLVELSFDAHRPPMAFWLYYHKDVYRSAALEAFLDIVRKQFDEFSKEAQ